MDDQANEALERVVVAYRRAKESRIAESQAAAQLAAELEAAESAGVRQADIARACGVARQAVYEWKRRGAR